MPGRVASDSAPTRARRTVSRRQTVAVDQIPDEGADSSLRHSICAVFVDAQKSTAGHRKCVIALRRIQEQCCYEPTSQRKGKQAEEYDEDQFNHEFVRCMLRILVVRKAENAGDRVVRFIGTYLNTAAQKDSALVGQDEMVDETILPETPTSRLITQTFNTLIPLLTSKDKTVRFRTTQIISHIVNSLDSLDDELFHLLRTHLLKRIHDKEAPVRLQAVYGLGRLVAGADEEVDDDEDDSDREAGPSVLLKLLDILQNDPSAEVRRNLLLNLPLNKEILPYLLERARDADSTTRRALYARLLPSLGDFQHLSLTHREKLLRWGLRDRDETVRAATAKLFRDRWIENCAAQPAGEEIMDTDAQSSTGPSLDALLELLERIDVMNSGAEDGVGLVAMQEFWDGRPDYVSYITFADSYWEEISPELAFVARTFSDYCRSAASKRHGPQSLESLAEEKLPEVTKFCTILQNELKGLIEAVRQTAAGGDADIEEAAAQREFIVEQMLHIALTFDYSDEVGRRKMFGLVREALALPELPEEVTKLAVEVLRSVCGSDARGEKEFCGVVLEAIAEVHDTIMIDSDEADTSATSESLDESFHSANSHQENSGSKNASRTNRATTPLDESALQLEREKAVREIMVNMKCLHIAQCMLQNVACELEENVHLVTMLNNLIVPAVRSQEAPIRERGLVCLGLSCLLGKNLAEENLTLFMHCFNKGHPTLQAIALQIIGDVLVTHPTIIAALEQTEIEGQPSLKQIIKAFSKSLKSGDQAVQATGVIALAKIMLSRLIVDADLLKQLVVAYFDPSTAGNPQLRQSLTYFLPVYCHSRVENAVHLAEIVCPIMTKLTTIREAYLEEVADAEDDTGMVSMTAISNMLIDWTDPRKIFGFNEDTMLSTTGAEPSSAAEIHFVLAENVLERLVTTQMSKDERKVLLALLGKLYLPSGGCKGERLKTVHELVVEAMDGKVAPDVTSKNILSKIEVSIQKMLEKDPSSTAAAADSMLQEQRDKSVEVTASAIEQQEDSERAIDDAAMAQLSFELRESTIGIPDAEGTRMMLLDEDDEDLLSGSE